MEDFMALGKDASVAEIQEKIKGMSAETKETLLRHEKGGLLKRMLELDPTKEYEEGEIWGNKPKASAAPAKPAAKPASAPVATASTKPPSTRASIDYSKFNAVEDDEAKPAVKPPSGSSSSAPPTPPPAPPPTSMAAPPTAESDAALAAAPIPSTALDLMPSLGGRRAFTFVRLPVENSVAMGEQMGFDLGDGDVLPTLLAPLFKSDLKLDPEVVARETAARYAEMVAMQEQQAGKGAAGGGVSAEVASGAMKAQAAGGEELPSSSELEKQAKLGAP